MEENYKTASVPLTQKPAVVHTQQYTSELNTLGAVPQTSERVSSKTDSSVHPGQTDVYFKHCIPQTDTRFTEMAGTDSVTWLP